MSREKQRMPALFIGHGSPMNVVQKNDFTHSLADLAEAVPKPEAILVVSAHWLTRGTYITDSDRPRQIYDFYGFPEELYRISYQPKGAAPFSKQILDVLNPEGVLPDSSWGLDHASWAVLKHMYPKADVPVVELSLDMGKDEEYHYRLGAKLRQLRNSGILVMGSGNVVHNLRMMHYAESAEPYPWAVTFEQQVKDCVLEKDHKILISYLQLGQPARLSVPTRDHYLPLLYTLALQEEDETASILYQGIQHGSVSMLCFSVGL